MSDKTIKAMLVGVIGIPGVVICFCTIGFLPTVGFLLIVWANNIQLATDPESKD